MVRDLLPNCLIKDLRKIPRKRFKPGESSPETSICTRVESVVYFNLIHLHVELHMPAGFRTLSPLLTAGFQSRKRRDRDASCTQPSDQRTAKAGTGRQNACAIGKLFTITGKSERRLANTFDCDAVGRIPWSGNERTESAAVLCTAEDFASEPARVHSLLGWATTGRR
jgi:hypothetical protein